MEKNNGVSPNVENMNISDRGIFNMYGNPPAIIEAFFDAMEVFVLFNDFAWEINFDCSASFMTVSLLSNSCFNTDSFFSKIIFNFEFCSLDF